MVDTDNVIKILLANKNDTPCKRQVKLGEGNAKAQELDMRLYSTSAVTGD